MSEAAAGSASLKPHIVTAEEAQDRAALQHLVSAYGLCVDRRDYATLRTLYHDDAVDDHAPFFVGPATDYVNWLDSMMANWSATSHTMFNLVFLLDGNRAEGVVSARAWHRTADGTRDFIAWGRYADRYEKRDGIWRFAHRFFVLDSIEDRAVEPGSTFGTDGVEVGRAGADDPIYRRLSMFGVDRPGNR